MAVLVAVAALACLAAVAWADHDSDGKKSIVFVDRSDKSATHLASAISEGPQADLVRSKFVTVPPGGQPVAISDMNLSGFPRAGHSFAILSTGCALLADNPNKSGKLGCRNGGVKARGGRDVIIWRIRVKVPRGANCLSFRFKFLSDEYPEWVDSIYNDALIAEVGHAPKWNASGNQDPTIRAPRNFATTRDGNLVSVNGTGVARVSRAAAKGTTYDAATGKLRASKRVKPGSQLLYISIFDQGDRQYDSAVFIDQLLVRNSKNCKSGVVASK